MSPEVRIDQISDCCFSPSEDSGVGDGYGIGAQPPAGSVPEMKYSVSPRQGMATTEEGVDGFDTDGCNSSITSVILRQMGVAPVTPDAILLIGELSLLPTQVVTTKSLV